MASPIQQKQQREEKAEKAKSMRPDREESMETLIRIAGFDIPGSKKLFPGLTRIKGVGWTISNATCIKLGLPKDKRISELTKDEIKKIEEFLSNPDIMDFLKNRRKDEESGETGHFIGTDLDFKKDFDIRKMKKIRSYKGIRHTSKLPVRGQRTRSHFRNKSGASGVKKVSAVKAAAPAKEGKK